MDFEEAWYHDLDSYGHAGPLWKAAYGSPSVGDTIWMPDNNDSMFPATVTFVGDYTIDVSF